MDDAPAPPYGLGAMLEDTLTAPLRPLALFEELARKPAPDYGIMLLNLLVYWTVTAGIVLVHAAAAHPGLARGGPALPGLIALCALFLAVLLSFLGAAILHVFCLLAGGSGGFIRSYQIVSTLSLLAPLQALAGWVPSLWPAPALAAAFLTAAAAERLHRSPAARTRLLFGGVCAFSLLCVWFIRAEIEKILLPYQAASRAFQDMRSLQALPPFPLAPALTVLQSGQVAPVTTPLLTSPPPASSAPLSGLDLLSAPSQGGAGLPAAPSAQQAEAMRQTSAGMLNSLLPMLQDPNLTRDMDPEQARQMKALLKAVTDMQGNLQSGKPLSPQQQAQMMQLMQQMMQNLPQMPAPAPGQQPEGGGR